MRFSVTLSDVDFGALQARAVEEQRPVAQMAAFLLRDALAGRVVPAWARNRETLAEGGDAEEPSRATQPREQSVTAAAAVESPSASAPDLKNAASSPGADDTVSRIYERRRNQ